MEVRLTTRVGFFPVFLLLLFCFCPLPEGIGQPAPAEGSGAVFNLELWWKLASLQVASDDVFRNTRETFRQLAGEESVPGRKAAEEAAFPREMHSRNTFFRHVTDAIAVNLERRELYSKLSGGQTERISSELIAMEHAMIPLAKLLDRWAEKYHKLGIPIITDDFVSMALVKAFDAPLEFGGPPSKNIREKYRKILRVFSRQARLAIFLRKFQRTAQITQAAVEEIRQLEIEGKCHFAMTCHMLESIGLCARNSEGYRQQSRGATDALAQALLASQYLGLRPLARLDFLAHPTQAHGIGILVNDIPPIPFP